MKRILSFLLQLCFIATTLSAENLLSVTSSSGHPGDEVTVQVSLENTDAVSAVQLDFPLDGNLAFVKESVVMDSLRAGGHNLLVTETNVGVRIVIYSLSLKNLKGTSGSLCSFKLKLGKEPALYTLLPSVVLTSSAGVKLDCDIKRGGITILSPKMYLSTDSIDFGKVAIRNTYLRQLNVQNTGTEALHVTDLKLSTDDFKTDDTDFYVEPGDSKNIVLSYSPQKRGRASATLTLLSNSMSGIQSVAIQAESYSVNEIHLQSAEGCSDEVVQVSVHMNNMEPIAAVQFTLNLPDELEYVKGSVRSCYETHTAIANQSGQQLKLMMYSSQSRLIEEGDGELLTFELKITGKSGSYPLKPENVVLGTLTLENVCSASDGTEIAVLSPSASVSDTLDFERCDITTGTIKDFVIQNTGQKSLVVSKCVVSDDGGILQVDTIFPILIDAGTSVSIPLKVLPKKEGRFTSAMTLFTNDPDNRMISVVVNGEAYAPNIIEVEGTVNVFNLQMSLNVGLKNYSAISALQMDVHCPAGVYLVEDSLKTSERLINHRSNCISLGGNNYRIVVFSLTNDTIPGYKGILFEMPFKAENLKALDSKIVFDDIKISSSDGINKASETNTSFRSPYIWGDVNGDNQVDITDAVVIVNAYLTGQKNEGCDLNQDGIVDISDAVQLIGIFSNLTLVGDVE